MNIRVKKKNGYIQVNLLETEKLVAETLLMVPGIVKVGHERLFDKVKVLLAAKKPKAVICTPLGKEAISIECHVCISANMNIAEVAKQVQDIVKYSVEKHYGIKVELVDVFVEGIV